MTSFRSLPRIIIAGCIIIACYQPLVVTAFTPLQPYVKISQNNNKDIKMTIDAAAVMTEEPKSTAKEIPLKIEKQYSSSRVSSVNLLKNMLGAGVFSLNSRVAGISMNPITMLYVSMLVFTMASWATYNFYMVGETCR